MKCNKCKYKVQGFDYCLLDEPSYAGVECPKRTNSMDLTKMDQKGGF